MPKLITVRDRINKIRLDVQALYLVGEGLRTTSEVEDGDAVARIAIRLMKKIDRVQEHLRRIDEAGRREVSKQSAAA
jgi:hypothetical protein